MLLNLRSATFNCLISRELTFCWINIVIDSSRARINIKKMSSVLKSSMKYWNKTWYYRVERDCNNILFLRRLMFSWMKFLVSWTSYKLVRVDQCIEFQFSRSEMRSEMNSEMRNEMNIEIQSEMSIEMRNEVKITMKWKAKWNESLIL